MADSKVTSEELKALKAKISAFEEQLREMVESSRLDLEIAAQLQKALMPNRLPQLQGITCFARYLSAQQLSSEGFDIIPTQKGRETWLVTSWTERFGLSSVLLQALVHLQSKALVEAHPNLSPAEVFNDLSISLTGAKRAGAYRLLVARFEPNTLRFSGVSIGSAPLLRRSFQNARYSEFETVQAEALKNFPDLLKPAHSDAPVTADRAYHFSFQLAPGSRLYYLSSAWADSPDLGDFLKPLKLTEQGQKPGSEMLDDLNHLLMSAEDHLKAQGRECDITAIGFQVDPGKLHLA